MQAPMGQQPVMMAPQQGMMMQGQQQMMGQVQQDPRALMFATTMSGFAKLDAVSGIFVKQKLDIFEAMTGCELPNKYYVYELNAAAAGLAPEGEAKPKSYYSSAKGLTLFKAKEQSGCFERQFCRGEARPLDIALNHEAPTSFF